MTKPKFFTISEVLTPAFVRFNLDILYNENIAALGLFFVSDSLFEFYSDCIYGPFLTEEEASHEEFPELIHGRRLQL